MGTRSASRGRRVSSRGSSGERAGPLLRASVGGAVVLVLVAGAAAVLSFALNAPGGSRAVGPGGLSSAVPSASTEAADAGPAGDDGTRILVHVLGAVAQPGLYELQDGERIVDAVAAAGGFTEKADQAALNLARAVADGEQVYVPAVGEVPPVPQDSEAGGLVNLNTADAAALETLPGLGPELAARIVEWRTQNGPFASVDDLLNVTGIGAKTVSGLADLATT